MASIDRTAYPQFKRVVSVRELAEAFTLAEDEAVWARSRTTIDQLADHGSPGRPAGVERPVLDPRQPGRFQLDVSERLDLDAAA